MPAINLKKLNAADWITATRLFAVPVIIITTFLELQTVTGLIILFAFGTDMIDGIVARRFKLESPFGAKLDSIADATLLFTATFSIIFFFTDFVTDHLWQIAILMGLYVFQMVFALFRYKQLTSFHTYAAKLSFIVVGLFIIICFFFQPVEWLFYVVWVIGLIEQAEEITLMFLLPRLRSNVKGVYWVLKERKN